jgi:integrase
MKADQIAPTMEGLLAKMSADGYRDDTMGVTRWVIGLLSRWCGQLGIEDVTVPVLARFVGAHFGFDYHRPALPVQTVLRRPLMILLEFHEGGTYCKAHHKGSLVEVPEEFGGFFLRYRDFVNAQGVVVNSKKRKLWVVSRFLGFLSGRAVGSVGEARQDDLREYLASLTGYAESTRRQIATCLREAFDWAHGEGIAGFSGRQALPLLRREPRTRILSYYTEDEVRRTLAAVDTSTGRGKLAYLAISLMAHLGMRAGDVVNLRFDEIDWNTGTITITQQKTGAPLTLPLVDEVRYPLLDYLRGGRPESHDEDYVLATCHPPHTRLASTASLYRLVSRHLDEAGIDTAGRRRGPHALRHSLATGLMRENVPLSAISSILGHSSTRVTEAYLQVDTTGLAQFPLEVPDVF